MEHKVSGSIVLSCSEESIQGKTKVKYYSPTVLILDFDIRF